MPRLLMLLILAAGPAFGQAVEGVWRTEPSETGAYLHVRIAPCGDRLCGRIDAAHATARTDLVGRLIIADMAPDGRGAWSGGTIWAPVDERTYRARMRLEGGALQVDGCVLVVCRGQTWTRQE